MQAALRSASRRAAGAASRRGVATTTTTELEKEWVKSVVRREVSAQMLAAEERSALEHAQEAEWSALRRAAALEAEASWDRIHTWQKGFLTGCLSFFTGGAIGALLIQVQR